jgi:hypothetical protein
MNFWTSLNSFYNKNNDTALSTTAVQWEIFKRMAQESESNGSEDYSQGSLYF